ncbi:MOSC domain-containing protein [Micromonospora echinofusca]|uniref:MOSC domain-containing protein n=1 Tax=Micromonospora echinofusca TaxID=47858 RepID=A0ABS3VV90_MICEH|nr:MOSC N-terminal beta barrel domain-containing protein [Micromonospora echinofusca]MBO4208445.1 MOSC domain-containing protein [Micromonospora echinofusca]
MRVASIHTYPVKGGRRLDHDAAPVEPWGLAGDRRWMVVGPDLVALTQRQLPGLALLRPAPYPGRSRPGAAGGISLRAPGRTALDVPEPTTGDRLAVRVFTHQPPVPVRVAGPDADAWLSDLLHRPVRLVWLDEPTAARQVNQEYGSPDDRVSLADGYPLLLANADSLADLNTGLAGAAEEPVPMTRFRPNLVVDGAGPWAEDSWLGGRLRVGPVTFRVVKPCVRCVVTTVDQETGVKGQQPLRVLADRRRVGQDLLFGVHLIPDVTGTVRCGDPVGPLT